MARQPITVQYFPRPQFVRFHARTERFACIVAHRRAGKTVACVHDLHRAAIRSRKLRPRYAYISPFVRQSKTVAWDYLRDAIAPAYRVKASAHETELRVDYSNGGQVRLYGADNPDALRGIYLDGVVLDEYADMDPRVWSEVIRPALADRQGWAVFIGTPKGRNAFFELWRRSQQPEEPRAGTLADAQGQRERADSRCRARACPARSHRRSVRAGIRMLVRCRDRRRLLRQADAAGRARSAHRRRAATIRPRWCGPRGTSASATPPRSGSRR